MPYYSMMNTETQEEFEINLKYSDLQEYLEANPHIKQVFRKFPGTVDPVRVGLKKPDAEFRDVLKKATVHKHNTINTW